ncbi:TPA: hypothetical protein ENS27_17370 [bacterium]|nr:hypothetical protein [bacterium]
MRKAQAALEFLMTYGWAIMVVLAAIGALAYFGVLSPSNFLPDQCTGLGQTIYLSNANTTLPQSGTVYYCAKGVICGTTTPYSWSDGSDVTIVYNFTAPLQTTSFKGTLQLNYTNANSGLRESIVVQVAGKVK